MSSTLNDLLGILATRGAQLHALLTRLTLREDVAEDLLQELFLRLRLSEGFRHAENQEAFAFRTAINLASDWRRTRLRQRDSERLQAEPPADGGCPLQRLVDAEDFERILDALPELPELSRTTLVLHYLNHRCYAEIAREIGKTDHQVRGLCYKAVSQLRVLLGAVPETPDMETPS